MSAQAEANHNRTYQLWFLFAQLLVGFDSRQCRAHLIWMLESTSSRKEWYVVSRLTRDSVLRAKIAVMTPRVKKRPCVSIGLVSMGQILL